MIFVFDIDDTLYDLMAPFETAYKECFANKTDIDCLTLFKRSRVHSDVVLMKEKEGLIPSKDCFYERMKLTCEEADIPFSRTECDRFEDIYRQAQKTICLYNEMKELLDYCVSHCTIAILSNGNHAGQYGKVDALHLHDYVDDDHIFVSGDIGFHKPERGAFEYVAKALNAKPDEMWYVGDTYESDILGAHNAGWHTIYINHRLRDHDNNVADITLTKRSELLQIIVKLISHT